MFFEETTAITLYIAIGITFVKFTNILFPMSRNIDVAGHMKLLLEY